MYGSVLGNVRMAEVTDRIHHHHIRNELGLFKILNRLFKLVKSVADF